MALKHHIIWLSSMSIQLSSIAEFLIKSNPVSDFAIGTGYLKVTKKYLKNGLLFHFNVAKYLLVLLLLKGS